MKIGIRLLFALALAFVGLNVVLVWFAPLVWHVELLVNLREASGAPVSGARVELLDHAHGRVLATRDSDVNGVVRFPVLHQQQPLWVWPPLGTLELRESMRIRAPDRRVVEQDLAPALGRPRLGTGRVEFVLELPAR